MQNAAKETETNSMISRDIVRPKERLSGLENIPADSKGKIIFRVNNAITNLQLINNIFVKAVVERPPFKILQVFMKVDLEIERLTKLLNEMKEIL